MSQNVGTGGRHTHWSFGAMVPDLPGTWWTWEGMWLHKCLTVRAFSAKMGQRHARDHAKDCLYETKQRLCLGNGMAHLPVHWQGEGTPASPYTEAVTPCHRSPRMAASSSLLPHEWEQVCNTSTPHVSSWPTPSSYLLSRFSSCSLSCDPELYGVADSCRQSLEV